jgi:Undecaprenyl-phosphate glucose phosphotransferase
MNTQISQDAFLPPGRAAYSRHGSEFFSKYGALLDVLQRLGDVAVVAGSAWVMHWLRLGSWHPNGSYLAGIVIAVLVTLLVFPMAGLYRSWRGERLTVEIGRVWAAWAGVMAVLFVLNWMTKSTETFSRLWFGGWFLGAATLFALNRILVRRLMGSIRAHGIDTRKAILVGSTRAGKQIVEAARNNPWMGIEVVGYIETPDDQVTIEKLPRLGNLEWLLSSIPNALDQLWVALPMRAEDTIRKVVAAFNDTTTSIRLVPDLFGYQLLNHHSTDLAGVPVITLSESRVVGHAHLVKAIEDRVLGALILVLISPLMLLIALGIKLTSPGPILFKQMRHGIGGCEVEVWKFRTMRLHEETNGTVTQATRHDPRVTPFGRFLRRTSLDELPQFLNVLQGTMSIVGPRPHAIEHNRHYERLVRHYGLRNHMKPGITGWAQVNGCRGETETVEKMARRVKFDLLYIRNWSIWLDFRIIALTIVRGFLGKNAY